MLISKRRVGTTDERSEEGRHELHRLREKENCALTSVGFAPSESDLWKRNGVLYGREAALQRAFKEIEGQTR